MNEFAALAFAALILVSCCRTQEPASPVGLTVPAAPAAPAAESKQEPGVPSSAVDAAIAHLLDKHGADYEWRIRQGVTQAADLWRPSDGTPEDFLAFCQEHFIADPEEREVVFQRLANNFEYLDGYMGRIGVELNRQIHEDRGPLHAVDRIFGAFEPAAHVQEDLYGNKIAFIAILNFPNYSLDEKNQQGKDWSPREWGYARLGDRYTARVPAEVLQENAKVFSAADLYISEYNIFAGQLRDERGKSLFPSDMKLLSHWNLRDEIKSNYGNPEGLARQEMLYQVMLRIIHQDIPKQVINDATHQWNPHTNELFRDGAVVAATPEDTLRYQHLLNNFHAMRRLDPYHPTRNTYIKRALESTMEIPMDEVKQLFKEYASSPLVRQTAALVKKRLGRDLRPYDLWYDGFLGRGGVSEDELTAMTRTRYPNAVAMKKDLPRMLRDLGFADDRATFLADHIDVDAARGSGHALGASMRQVPSHLRTRIAAEGMDYKGYNIAIHELGHNVEQTISLHQVYSYFLTGVPNTAFTEALAFLFQRRDLALLGFVGSDPMKEHLEVLDVFWDNYEMMGVSLVDMTVWEWMYDHPDADAAQLKEAVIRIAREVWNEFYADVFGERDVSLLAIYSHMIYTPLYLMNYPYGRLIMFQLEEYVAVRNLAEEIWRIFSLGRLTPQHWMHQAVGGQISNQPLFSAVERALKAL